MSTLIQGIPTFNGSDAMQLEDWLVDIETAADLTRESRTKLVQAKSKGLTHTLITEALTSDKCWEEIKDLLCLKICNLDIHTSVSHFMDIQQKDKKSLAAYVHRFKREAMKCNFNNNVATIRIFVKGLKNAHTLAAHVYEKIPQTLADTISDVEELQAALQLTATLLPSSTVNVMSNEEDQCFQGQELGHIACHCPNTQCFECDEYGYISADCQTGYHHQACLHTVRVNTPVQGFMPDLLLDIVTGTVTDVAGQDHSHNLTDIEVTVITTHTEVIPGHIKVTITGALLNTITPALAIITMIHHTRGHPHVEFPQLIPGIAVDPDWPVYPI